mgnify:CR=1 FL=1
MAKSDKKTPAKKNEPEIRLVSENRKARFRFDIIDTLECGIQLTGSEVKSLRDGKLSLDDMQGAGFTITNLGGIGGTSFTPIVNWPEVAILGISRGAREPVFVNDQFEPRLMLPLSLSYDHRVIDGADAARFLRWVAEAFEQPFMMSL